MSGVGALATRPALFAAVEPLSLAVGFVLQAWLMRALGPAAYGAYALACALGVVAATLTDFGFNFSGVTRAIELAHDDGASRRHFCAVQMVKLLAGAVAVVFAAAWSWLAGTEQAAMIVLATAVGAASVWCLPSWFFFSRHKMVMLACSLLAARVLCLIAAVVIVGGPAQLSWAIFFTLCAPIIALPIMLTDAQLRAQLVPRRPDRSELVVTASSGLSTLWLSAQTVVSGAVLQSLLFDLTSSATLGVFAAADRVRAGVQGLFAAFGAAAFPRFVQFRVEGDSVGDRRTWPLLRLQLALAAAAGLVMFVLAPDIVRIVLGPQFPESTPVLRVLALALVGTTLFAGLGVQLMLPSGMGRQYTIATLAVLGLQCFVLMVVTSLVPGAGALGAAWAVALSEGAVALFLIVRLSHRRPS